MVLVKKQEVWTSPSLREFIHAVNQQREGALCIAESENSVPLIAQDFRNNGYTLCRDIKSAIRHLTEGVRVALVADTVSRELYELFSQYNERSGMVQIFDRVSFSFLSIHLPVTISRFVVVTTNSALLRARGSLLPHAGLIFRGTL